MVLARQVFEIFQSGPRAKWLSMPGLKVEVDYEQIKFLCFLSVMLAVHFSFFWTNTMQILYGLVHNLKTSIQQKILCLLTCFVKSIIAC